MVRREWEAAEKENLDPETKQWVVSPVEQGKALRGVA
jgi:hypothetical protein